MDDLDGNAALNPSKAALGGAYLRETAACIVTK